jgi:hypothetical protein
MQAATVQSVPLTILALVMNPNGFERQAMTTGNAATMEWHASGGTPTESFDLMNFAAAVPSGPQAALSMMALAEAVLSDSRPLADWERKDADEFFWSHFS